MDIAGRIGPIAFVVGCTAATNGESKAVSPPAGAGSATAVQNGNNGRNGNGQTNRTDSLPEGRADGRGREDGSQKEESGALKRACADLGPDRLGRDASPYLDGGNGGTRVGIRPRGARACAPEAGALPKTGAPSDG